MNAHPPILVTRGAAHAGASRPGSGREPASPRATAWAHRLARATGAPLAFAPAHVPARKLLDTVYKSGARWIVTEPAPHCLAHDHYDQAGCVLHPFEPDFRLLLRRAPAAVMSVQPWADIPSGRLRTAVVAVDRSGEARAAARAAAEILADPRAPGRLILVHGVSVHPDELATTTPWPRLRQQMLPEAHGWIFELAGALRSEALRVDAAVHPTWAPELVSGMARREGADFVALGIAARGEPEPCPLSPIHQRLLRSAPCPVVTAR